MKALGFWLFLLAGMVVVFATAVVPVYDQNLKLKHRLDVEQARLDFLQQRNSRLNADVTAAEDDPFYIEVMARRELKQVRRGEDIRTVEVAEPAPRRAPLPAVADNARYRRLLALTTDPTNRSVLYTCGFGLILLSIFIAVRARPKAHQSRTVAVEAAREFDEAEEG